MALKTVEILVISRVGAGHACSAGSINFEIYGTGLESGATTPHKLSD
jgi:hypothetical protein